MEKTFKRIDYIDIMKAIAIILVILGHIGFANEHIHKYIYSFHMPLFFISYGLTYKPREYNIKTLKNVILSKIKRLYIPYVLWALIFSNLTFKNLFYILYGSHITLRLGSNSSLWFLPCLFISVMFFELLNAVYYKINLNDKLKNMLYVITIVFSILVVVSLPGFSDYNYPLCFDVAFMGLAFILIGTVIKSLIQYLKLTNWHLVYLILAFIILFLGTFTYNLNTIDYVLMAENQYGNIFYFFVTAMCGFFATLVLSIILDKVLSGIIKKALIFIGQNTLIIFVLHKLIISLIGKIISHFNLLLPNVVILTLTTIICLIVSAVFIKLIDSFVPELSGKKMKISNS